MAARVTARIAAFIPEASPPEVRIPIYSSFFIYLSSCFVSFCQYSFQFFPAVKNTALYSSQTHAGSFRYLTVFES